MESVYFFFLCICSAPEIKKDSHQNAIPKRPVNYNCKHHQNKQFIYDDHGRIVKVLGPENRIKEFKYNKRGYIQTIITNDEKQKFEYNINGKIIRCKDSTGTTKIDRYPDGNIHRMIYPSGDTITYSYYDDGKLFEIIWKNNHYLSIYRNVLGDAVKIVTMIQIHIRTNENSMIVKRPVRQ